MGTQTLAGAPPAAVLSSRAVVRYRAVLWAALLSYPFVPSLLSASAGLASSSRALAAAGVLLSYAWSIGAPVAAWFALGAADDAKLNRREHPQVAREATFAAIAAPWFVLSGVILGWVHLRGYQGAFWYAALAGLAAARWLTPPRSDLIRQPAWQRAHRASAVLLVLFGAAHVGNHLAAVGSLQAHVTVQNALRAVYRQPAIEALIIAAALLQVCSGWVIVSRARLQRANGIRNLQVLAGSFLGMFFLSHLTGVLSGRLQNVDTTFAWATGGPGGLLSNTRSPSFLPYYSLAVLAFGVHAAIAARWALAGALGQARALKLCYALLAACGAVTLVMLLPLCGVHLQ